MAAIRNAVLHDHRHRRRCQAARRERSRDKDRGAHDRSNSARFYRSLLPVPCSEAAPRQCHACGTRSASGERSVVQAPPPVSLERRDPHGENRHGTQRSKRRNSGRLVQAQAISGKRDESGIVAQRYPDRKHYERVMRDQFGAIIDAVTVAPNSNLIHAANAIDGVPTRPLLPLPGHHCSRRTFSTQNSAVTLLASVISPLRTAENASSKVIVRTSINSP